MTTIEPGSWVLCWGQVGVTQGHPDDTLVTIESHNEDYQCYVRTDRIVIPSTLPDFAPQCNALAFKVPGTYLRCELHHGHHGMHRGSGDVLFDEPQVRGYIEEV
jgi:hypothetical protein